MANDQFIDYYDLMQISPTAEPETVQRVYKALASRYHPNNPRTGDPDRFKKLAEGYKVLSDRAARARYDATHSSRSSQPLAIFETREFSAGIDGEANRRMGLLSLLYLRRRSNAESPGLSILRLEDLTALPREHLMFTLWYLKDADLIRQEENSDFVITAQGVDHLEKNLSSNQTLYELMKAAEVGSIPRSGEPDGAAAPQQ